MEKYQNKELVEAGENKDTYKLLLEKAKEKPVDAIVVLSGGIKKIVIGENIRVIAGENIYDEEGGTDEHARLSSTSYSGKRPDSGKAKEIAAAEMVKDLALVQGERKLVVITSSREPFNKTSVSDAEIAKEHMRKLGVENEIITQVKSIDTFTELLEAIRLAKERNWKHLAISVLETQKKRAEAMAYTLLHLEDPVELHKAEGMMAYNANRFNRSKMPDRLDDLLHYNQSLEYIKGKDAPLEISFVEAEDAIVHRHPEFYSALVKKIRASADYESKLTRDENDSNRWVSGAYSAEGDQYIEKWKKGELP